MKPCESRDRERARTDAVSLHMVNYIHTELAENPMFPLPFSHACDMANTCSRTRSETKLQSGTLVHVGLAPLTSPKFYIFRTGESRGKNGWKLR